jgi:hypothetical protein
MLFLRSVIDLSLRSGYNAQTDRAEQADASVTPHHQPPYLRVRTIEPSVVTHWRLTLFLISNHVGVLSIRVNVFRAMWCTGSSTPLRWTPSRRYGSQSGCAPARITINLALGVDVDRLCALSSWPLHHGNGPRTGIDVRSTVARCDHGSQICVRESRVIFVRGSARGFLVQS